MTATKLADLDINGDGVMQATGEDAGERIGWILDVLLKEVSISSDQNMEDKLRKRAVELAELGDSELQKLSPPKLSPPNKEKFIWGPWIERFLQIAGFLAILYVIYTGKMPWNW